MLNVILYHYKPDSIVSSTDANIKYLQVSSKSGICKHIHNIFINMLR